MNHAFKIIEAYLLYIRGTILRVEDQVEKKSENKEYFDNGFSLTEILSTNDPNCIRSLIAEKDGKYFLIIESDNRREQDELVSIFDPKEIVKNETETRLKTTADITNSFNAKNIRTLIQKISLYSLWKEINYWPEPKTPTAVTKPLEENSSPEEQEEYQFDM